MAQSSSTHLPAEKKEKRTFKNLFAKSNFDIWFLVLVMTLLTIGTIMMFSASFVNAKYSASTGYDALFYLKRQLRFIAVGLVLMFVVSNIDYKIYNNPWMAYSILGICLLLLVYVLINPMVIEGKEEIKRWILIPGIGQFQPSDLAKLGIVMFFSWGFSKKRKPGRFKHDSINIALETAPYLFLTAVFCFLLYKEEHNSGLILIFMICVCMTFLGGRVKTKWYLIAAIVVVLLAALLIVNREHIDNVRFQERLSSWLDKDSGATGSRWQINQSLYAIGSGGLFGVGLGNSKQKHLYLPEAQNDFVFAIVCEELGFLRAILIIILFLLLIWRGVVIAMRSKDRYGTLLVMGIIFKTALQTVINICVVTDILPNTGISLPFFSYGGTAIVMLLVEMGLVLSVSRYSQVRRNERDK